VFASDKTTRSPFTGFIRTTASIASRTISIDPSLPTPRYRRPPNSGPVPVFASATTEPPPKKWTVNVLKRKNISYEQNEWKTEQTEIQSGIQR
jgi:hypothetical protein